MKKGLIIVESPVKAKKIQRFLDEEMYTVRATLGHVVDLPRDSLGVDLESLQESYVPISRKDGTTSEQLIKVLRQLAKEHEHVYLASDPDREGEAIAGHLRDFLYLREGGYSKIDIHAITSDGVRKALRNPRPLNEELLKAQSARRVLDRFIGYGLSPIVHKEIPDARSVGRLQLAGLRLICDREEEINSFKTRRLYSISAVFTSDGFEMKCYLQEKNWASFALKDEEIAVTEEEGDESENAGKLVSELELSGIVSLLQGKNYSVSKAGSEIVGVAQPKPLRTVDMQKLAASVLKWEADKTMAVAQTLFQNGFITYHRTDSTRIDTEATNEALDFIAQHYGEKYQRTTPISSKNSAGAQDAHESIRPSDIKVSTVKLDSYPKTLTEADLQSLYKLIRTRFMQVHMEEGKNRKYSLEVVSDDGKGIFYGTKAIPVFDGWRLTECDQVPPPYVDEKIPNIGATAVHSDMKEEITDTKPPSRYSAGSLVAVLEKKEIGRPSTYATVSAVLLNRRYIELVGKNQYKPTELGKEVRAWFNTDKGGHYIDLGFTAKMEKALDNIRTSQDRYRFLDDEKNRLVADFDAFRKNSAMSSKPTEKQISYLRKIQEKGKVPVPDEAFDSFAAAKAFLLEYKANMRPSEKQVELAKQLEARHSKAVLTDTMLESPKLLAEFIDKWIKVPSDVDDGQPPSEKQLKIIESLTEQLGCGIDATRTKTLKEAASYIDELMSASDTPPTEKQKDFAVQISEILSIDLKEDVLKSKRKTSAFIDKHLSAYRKKTGSGKKK